MNLDIFRRKSWDRECPDFSMARDPERIWLWKLLTDLLKEKRVLDGGNVKEEDL